MTRVLFALGAGHRAGAERVLLTLVRHLPDVGVEPVVAAFAEGPFVDELVGHDVRVVHLGRLPRAREVWKTSTAVDALAAAAVDVEAEVIQANGEKMAIFAGRAARRSGTASVVWLHDAPGRSAAATAVQLRMRTTPRDAAVAPSRWMAAAFRRRWGVRAEAIPHGIARDELPTEPADVRAAAGWPPDSVVVGHFARLERWKGAEEFLTAAAFVAEHRPEARFAVVGGALFGLDEGYAAALPRRAAELGLGDRIRFFGHRDDALALMRGCDVVVHSSTRPEPFGMVVLEAMALGRAVIASDSGGPAEMVDSGTDGLLAATGSAAGLAAALDRVVADPALRERLGAAAARTVSARYSATEMAARFASLYRRVTGDARRPRRRTARA